MPLNGVDACCSSRKLTSCLLQACYWPPVDLDSKQHNIACHLYALSERQVCLYSAIQSYTSYYAWNEIWKRWNRVNQWVAFQIWRKTPFLEDSMRSMQVGNDNFSSACSLWCPTPFEMFLIVAGHICRTYREAYNLHDFHEDDPHLDAMPNESTTSKSLYRLRNLFAIMLQTW